MEPSKRYVFGKNAERKQSSSRTCLHGFIVSTAIIAFLWCQFFNVKSRITILRDKKITFTVGQYVTIHKQEPLAKLNAPRNRKIRWRGWELSGTLAFENEDNADRDVDIRNTNKQINTAKYHANTENRLS